MPHFHYKEKEKQMSRKKTKFPQHTHPPPPGSSPLQRGTEAKLINFCTEPGISLFFMITIIVLNLDLPDSLDFLIF